MRKDKAEILAALEALPESQFEALRNFARVLCGWDEPKKPPNVTEERFERFWRAYPRKVGKAKAKAAFLRIRPTDELTDLMIAKVKEEKNSYQWQKDHGAFIPHPTTWLNGGRWEDEADPDTGRPGHRMMEHGTDYELEDWQLEKMRSMALEKGR